MRCIPIQLPLSQIPIFSEPLQSPATQGKMLGAGECKESDLNRLAKPGQVRGLEAKVSFVSVHHCRYSRDELFLRELESCFRSHSAPGLLGSSAFQQPQTGQFSGPGI